MNKNLFLIAPVLMMSFAVHISLAEVETIELTPQAQKIVVSLLLQKNDALFKIPTNWSVEKEIITLQRYTRENTITYKGKLDRRCSGYGGCCYYEPLTPEQVEMIMQANRE